MPSKGTPMRQFRYSDEEWLALEVAVERRNFWTRQEPWTLSDFIRIAIAEKLDKMRRCRSRKRPRPAKTGPELVETNI